MNTMMIKATVTALMPTDCRKSFYGKAIVKRYDDLNLSILESYGTPVCAYLNGMFFRLWHGWKATTGRHISAFTETMKGTRINKAGYEKMMTSNLSELFTMAAAYADTDRPRGEKVAA